VARLDWINLKKEYMLGDYKSLREFSDLKGLKYNGNFMIKTKGWNDERVAIQLKRSCKIIEKTIEKISDKESDRNVRFLNMSDMATDAIEEYLKEKHYKQHVVKYKYYDCEGKPTKDELKAVKLSVADTKAFSNMMGSLERIQKGQRLAEGLDDKNNSDSLNKGNDNIKLLADLLNSPVKDRCVQDFEDE
jgi:hypothetical protein